MPHTNKQNEKEKGGCIKILATKWTKANQYRRSKLLQNSSKVSKIHMEDIRTIYFQGAGKSKGWIFNMKTNATDNWVISITAKILPKNYTGSTGSLEKLDAFSNWQGQPFEATTPSLSIYIDGGKPMWAVRRNNNRQFQSYIREMATIPYFT